MFQSFETQGNRAAGPARLAALRARMAAEGVHGFLAPRGDAHMGETVAARDQRLAWLTGFTGSAGICVALAERAALFSDGRYTLQAREQVDAAFERVGIEATPPSAWLKSALKPGQRLAYDPWLHGREQIETLERACAEVGAELVPTANLIDAVWEDQPSPPMGPLAVHPEALAGESSAAKRARLGRELAEASRDAAVLTLPDSLAWLLNVRGSDVARMPAPHAFGLLRADGTATLFVAAAKLSDPVREHLGNAVEIADPEALGPALDALAGSAVLLDRASCPVWIAHRLEAAGARIDWGQDPCILPKARKNTAELEGARAAHLRDAVPLARFLRWVDETAPTGTLTEIAAVEKLENLRAQTGALRDISFDTICGAGPNGAIVHYRVTRETDRTLVPGELLLVDSGAQYPDGTTDVTRTLATGPAPEGAARAFTLVLKGMIAIAMARWPAGLAGRDIDALARQALWKGGLDYDHGTGHGVGAYLGVHEGPASISRRGMVPLEPGMVLSDEPGCYREGEWGIRLEILVAVSSPAVPEGGEREMLGFETLTLAPIDRRLVVPALLDPPERAWLDAYHARVAAEVTPLLDDPADRDWLAAACARLAD
ncbi:aminopeptidase P family protein [uncultured Albimonas sp.]|uniref:aminopeptidase P family protein n=1 Tax=uncultured Albimonas sp. TaxID=1331701 RepID=UPI0030EC9DE7|tara:strand:+ start:1509 stop:3320 length:1812 start_codon:yes stop_codon:yes gene_type:complete